MAAGTGQDQDPLAPDRWLRGRTCRECLPAETGRELANDHPKESETSIEPPEHGEPPFRSRQPDHPHPEEQKATGKAGALGRFLHQTSHPRLQYHWDASRKAALQAFVEKIQAHWPIDRDYMPPPSRGTLVTLDPALIVTRPKGLELGYVPIVTHQEPR